MRLAIRLNGKRLTISRAIAQLQYENARLRADLGLARSDAKEWRDRYDYLAKQVGERV